MEITGGMAITTEEMLSLGIKRSWDRGTKPAAGPAAGTMATLQKGNQETKSTTSFSSLLPLPYQSFVQTKSAVRGEESPLKKSIKVRCLGSSDHGENAWRVILEEGRGEWKIFQHNSLFFFYCRNQWQPNMRFLQIPTGLTILVTLGFSILFELKSNVHVVL